MLTLSGYVLDQNSQPISGIKVVIFQNKTIGNVVSSNYTKELQTNSSGFFIDTDVPVPVADSTLTKITPSSDVYTFKPAIISYNNISENKTDINFVGYSFSVSGYARKDDGVPVSNAKVTVQQVINSVAYSHIVYTNSNGRYESPRVPGYVQTTVFINKIGCSSTTTAKQWSTTTFDSDKTYDFQVSGCVPSYSLSGSVTKGSSALSGITIDALNIYKYSNGSTELIKVASTTSDANGSYTFDDLSGLNYYIKPSSEDCTFLPVQTYVSLSANATNINFSATCKAEPLTLTVDAGADVTSSFGNFSRTATSSPTTTEDSGLTIQWANVGHNLANTGSGATLQVNLPEPTEEYTDYTFQVAATSSNCVPTYVTDQFTVRVVKSSLSSVTISPDEVDLDLSTATTYSINFTPYVTPSTITVIKYTWSEKSTNPATSLIAASQINNKILTLSSWPSNGTYEFYCEVETVSGTATASTKVNVTGSAVTSTTPYSPTSANDICNIEFFIVDTSNNGLFASTSLPNVQNLPYTTAIRSGASFVLPTAYPAITSVHNNKLTASNEQYLYVVYQAFNNSKWEIYLRQIRLSENDKTSPTYEAPYNSLSNFPRNTIVKYVPYDYYIVQYKDESDNTAYVTRVKYHLTTNNDTSKIVRQDDYGYVHDVTIVITYEGNLSAYWYNNTVFQFSDTYPYPGGQNLTHVPFDLHFGVRLYNDDTIFGDMSTQYWKIIDNGNIVFEYNKFGYCGGEIADPILIASSDGHCTRPRVFCDYNNNVFVVYEDTENGTQQIKIVGTGDFAEQSILGPTGSYVTKFWTANDFSFSHSITGKTSGEVNEIPYDPYSEAITPGTIVDEGINQLPDITVDRNNIVHVVWQSNRDSYWNIYYANSTNFFDPVRITKTNSKSLNPKIITNDDGDVYISYHDDRFGKYQIFVSYQHNNRTIPLFQQDPYLFGFEHNYEHYTDVLTIPLTNSYSSGCFIHIILDFYEDQLFGGEPIISVSTITNPELFVIENETSAKFGISNGIYVGPNDTIYVLFLGSSSTLAFGCNSAYFVKVEYLYPDKSIIEPVGIDLTYSCSYCNLPVTARWTSSGSSYSDTRITFSSEHSINSSLQCKKSGRLVVLWEDYRFDETRVLGAQFSPHDDDIRSSGGNWFDYDYKIFGKKPSLGLDLFDRALITYDIDKEDGTKITTPLKAVAYRVCALDPLPTTATTTKILSACDYSNITNTILSDDPYIASFYIKQMIVHPDDVDYYTTTTSGTSIAVVSKCNLTIELLGTPEVMAYRIKNEDETSYSSWIPFEPEISNYYTQISHKLSQNSGIKEVCVEVATYSGITASFSITIVADYENIPYDIIMTTTENNTELELPLYEGNFVASTKTQDFIDVNIYIIVPDEVAKTFVSLPTFDVIQQGTNDLFGQNTIEASIPSGIKASGKAYKGTVTIYKQDNRYNVDGVANIKPRFDTECISEKYILSASANTRNQFNYFGKATVVDTYSDNLNEYRNPITGQIGILPDNRNLENNIISPTTSVGLGWSMMYFVGF